MRSSKSRSRNKNNRNRNNNSLGNVVNRVFDSNGPEGKVRGTPQQIIDKYNQLARDSALGNDRVATENFQQHAEHYLRLLSAAQKEQEAKREQQERENRERQAQRDRERAERDAARAQREGEAGEAQPQQQGEPEAAERPQRKPRRNEQPAGTGDQPDVIDVKADDDGPGLVETPESKAQAAPEAEAPAEAVEEKPKPKKPRAPRKPRAKKPAPEAEAEAAPAEEKAPKAETPPDAAE
ncbi:DUF4167 domain-containing protein [Pacificoceanicola onchidii]|uniref:DUF4167 domain-containing protein n=1 Tax=Pacificoceanicola onchidii TaxID=2562685 RepID=UPI0010A5C1A5|nr:DUF4167 domain-containing protein [Pacificoceanicola onchidii]